METTEKENFPTLSSLQEELPILPHYWSSSEDDDEDEDDDVRYRRDCEEPEETFSSDYEDEDDDTVYPDGTHMMTKEEYRKYLSVVLPSRGYDVSDELDNVRAFNQIIPMTESQIELKNVPDNCRKALNKYNETEGSQLKFVEVLKANIQNLFWFYITFKVFDPNDNEDHYKIFQTRVYYRPSIGEFIIDEVQPKPITA